MNIKDLFLQKIEDMINKDYFTKYGEYGRFVQLLEKQNGVYGENLTTKEFEEYKILKIKNLQKIYIEPYNEFVNKYIDKLINHHKEWHYQDARC